MEKDILEKQADSESYDRSASAFDLLLRDSAWRNEQVDRLLILARVKSNSTVLDVGTGTGEVAYRTLRMLDGEGSVVGIDHSQGMLEQALAQAPGDSRLSFRLMDAESLDLNDATFDSVISQFALLHFPDPARALKEASRVLKPGGYCAIGVGCGPPTFTWPWFTESVTRLVELLLARFGMCMLPSQLDSLAAQRLESPLRDLPASHVGRRTPRWVLHLFHQIFEDVQWDWNGGVLRVRDPHLYWRILTTFSTHLRELLHFNGPESAEDLRLEFEQTCHRVVRRGGVLLYPFASFIVAGRAR